AENLNELSADFNFKGILIENAYIDPINQLDYASLLHQIGLITDKEELEFENLQNQAKEEIKSEQWLKFAETFEKLIWSQDSIFSRLTGFQERFNFGLSSALERRACEHELQINQMDGYDRRAK